MAYPETALSLWKGEMALPVIRSRRSMRRIAEGVAEETGVSIAKMMSPDLHREIVYARHQFFYEAWQERKSYPEMGRFLAMDHSSCHYGANAHAKRNNLPIPVGRNV